MTACATSGTAALLLAVIVACAIADAPRVHADSNFADSMEAVTSADSSATNVPASTISSAADSARAAAPAHAAPDTTTPQDPAGAPRDQRAFLVSRARYLMGTICTAVAESPDSARAAHTIAFAFDEIDRLEQVMSSWKKDSEVTRLNTSGSLWFPCSPWLWAAIDSSFRYAQFTKGAFDPTIEPYNRAWDMRGKGRVAKPADLAQASILVGYQKVNLDRGEHRVMFPFTDMGMDFGGIGKGLALDRVARLMKRDSLRRVVIDFGGQVLVLGDHWLVKIAHPTNRLLPVIRLDASNGSVSTSSQSEHGFTIKKQRYGHIIDPRSGQPVAGDASVTVVAVNATRADALSTALLVMGRESALEFAKHHPDIGVLWLEPAGDSVRAWMSNLPGARAEPGITVEWMSNEEE